jgi:hypothetical protein
MKWLIEFGAANLACAGLPCEWPDEAAESPALEAAVADMSEGPEADSDAAAETEVLH